MHEHEHDWVLVSNVANTRLARFCKICDLHQMLTPDEMVEDLQKKLAEARALLEEIDNIDRDASGAIVTDSLYISDCPLCKRPMTGPDLREFGKRRGHAEHCLVLKVRAFLAQ